MCVCVCELVCDTLFVFCSTRPCGTGVGLRRGGGGMKVFELSPHQSEINQITSGWITGSQEEESDE